ncbi:hypothetical protein GCM10009744_13200 [Kribbella alba]|uniref:Uncharacterized protein n=1 Tax=Kribbella alba TaxID=190197 RepID=A0ABP4QY59_9ACTN
MFGSPVDDALGEDWTDAWQGLQLGHRGRVEVYLGCAGRSAWADGRRTGWNTAGDADQDLFAIGYLAGEVQVGQVDTGESSAGQGKHVGDAGSGFGTDQPGTADFSGYVDDDDLRRWGGCRYAGRRRLSDG